MLVTKRCHRCNRTFYVIDDYCRVKHPNLGIVCNDHNGCSCPKCYVELYGEKDFESIECYRAFSIEELIIKEL